jgi:phosphoglycolate phosphatase
VGRLMKLIIFDLDQTLVDLISVHDAAVRELFNTYFGVNASLREIDFAGKSLTENFVELARLKGIAESEFARKSKLILKHYEKIFQAKTPPTASNYILPGVVPLLEKLLKTSNFVVLYTGDSPGITQLVLHTTGLEKYFKFSVYGTEAGSRVELAKMAVARAEQLTGNKFEGRDIILIGDSIRDVECGKQLNAVTIAVTTGLHSKAELMMKKPDYLFQNLEDYRQILRIVEELPRRSITVKSGIGKRREV